MEGDSALMRRIDNEKMWINGIMGVVVGDILGMPVQFAARSDLKINPVKTVEGYGTYNMPPGTWSDDSSMTLATLDSIREKGEVDYPDIMERFVKWLFSGEYTPAGKAFDQGNTCVEAICNYVKGKDYKTCGKTGEWANGNGSLMRIMPVCLYAYKKLEAEAVETQHKLLLLDSTLKWLRKDGSLMDYNVTLKTIPERYVASVRQVIPAYDCEHMLWEIMQKELEAQNVQSAVPCYGMAIFHDVGYKEHDPDVEVQSTVIGTYQVCYPVKKK